MKQLVTGTTKALQMDELPEEAWDTFLDSVYNRMERKTGWWIFIAGVVFLALLGGYYFVTEPWGCALVKLGIATPVVGLAVLFISVLRQRLKTARTDRYSREVQR